MRAKILAGAAVVACLAAGALVAMPYIPGTDANYIHSAKNDVAASLNDPSSASFRAVEYRIAKAKNGPAKIVCGEVNGKNSFGALAGYRRFFYDPVGQSAFIDPASTVKYDDINREKNLCNDVGRYASCPIADRMTEEKDAQNQFDDVWRQGCAS